MADIKAPVRRSSSEILEDIERTRTSLNLKADLLRREVQKSVAEVKASANERIDDVKHAVDIRYQVRQNPWTWFGASIAAGLALGGLFGGRGSLVRDSLRAASSLPDYVRAGKDSGFGASGRSFIHKLAPEIDAVRALAIGAGIGLVRDLLGNNIPTSLSGQVSSIMDRATERLGGTPVHGNVMAGDGLKDSDRYH